MFLLYGTALIFWIVNNYLQNKNLLRLILFWEIAFIYLICLDGIIFVNSSSVLENSDIIKAARYLILSNTIFLFTYIITYKNKFNNNVFMSDIRISSKLSSSFLFILYIYFIYGIYDFAITSFFQGRWAASHLYYDDRSILGAINLYFNRSVGMVLPSIIAYYYKYIRKKMNHLYISLLVSLPIFILTFLTGVRFPLLFAALGFFLITMKEKLANVNVKFLLSSIVIVLVLLSLTQTMILMRGRANESIFELNTKNTYQSENIISSVAELVSYFEKNEHFYGLSNFGILVMFVPRAIWPEKPTLLGYWFIREISSVNKRVSLAYSFAGNSYVDFGMWFGALFSSVFGLLFAYLEKMNKIFIHRGNHYYLISTVFYPFAFFAVRGIDTAFFSLTLNIIIILLFNKTLKRIILPNSR